MTAPLVDRLALGPLLVPGRDDVVVDGERHPSQCLICGRGLTASAVKRGWWVHLVEGGDALLAVDGTYDEPGSDLGWHAVGTECAKRLPMAYRSRLPG